LGGDFDVGAIWAAVIEHNHFTVEAPGIDSITVRVERLSVKGITVAKSFKIIQLSLAHASWE
jgi:hypothetical protein